MALDKVLSLGTSIFLSAVLLGIVILFIYTKDSWNWKKIILWPFLVVAGLSILLGGGFYIYQSISNRPKPQTIFWGISLDSTKSDIKFIKGEPDKAEDDTWYYVPNKERTSFYMIGFKDNKIQFIAYDGNILDFGVPSLQGIRIGTTYDEVVRKFGEPSYISISGDELRRTLSYDKYNVFFGLEENKVYGFGIYNKTLGKKVKYQKEKKAD